MYETFRRNCQLQVHFPPQIFTQSSKPPVLTFKVLIFDRVVPELIWSPKLCHDVLDMDHAATILPSVSSVLGTRTAAASIELSVLILYLHSPHKSPYHTITSILTTSLDLSVSDLSWYLTHEVVTIQARPSCRLRRLLWQYPPPPWWWYLSKQYPSHVSIVWNERLYHSLLKRVN